MSKIFIFFALLTLAACQDYYDYGVDNPEKRTEQKLYCDFQEEKDFYENVDVVCKLVGAYITKPGFQSKKTLENVTILAGQYQYDLHYLPYGMSKVLPNLKSIYVGISDLKEISKENFDGLTELKQLKLVYNKISKIGEGSFDDLIEVLYLYLDNNLISEIPKNLFTNLAKLEYLSLQYNSIASLDANQFKNNVNINTLSLSGNKLSSLESGILDFLSNLKKFDAASNEITSLNPNLFKNTKALEWINLEFNNLTDIPVNIFANNPALIECQLDGNQFNSIDFAVFTPTTQIEAIKIGRIPIKTVLNVDVIDNLKNLEFVDFWNFDSCIRKTYDRDQLGKFKEDVKANCTAV